MKIIKHGSCVVTHSQLLRLLTVLLVLLLGCTGCFHGNNNPPEEDTQQTYVPTVSQGQKFLNSGFKIRTVITPQTVATLDPITFEVYVDGSGTGKGLVGYKDKVYDVSIVNDKLYVKIESNIAVQLSDITGHLILSSLNVSSMSDLSDAGFSLLNDSVVSYLYSDTELLINGAYQSSDSTFTAEAITAGNSMTIVNLINYILDYEGSTYVDLPGSETLTIESESFYINSEWGVTVDSQIYSIGDYINPSTYFNDELPSGITTQYGYNKDVRVEMLYTTYTSSKGKTEVMSTDGYVQSFSTSTYFKWLDIEYGMSQADLLAISGVNLKKKDLEEWTPMREGLTAEKGKNNAVVFKYSDITATITVDSKSKTVDGISLVRYLDFLDD